MAVLDAQSAKRNLPYFFLGYLVLIVLSLLGTRAAQGHPQSLRAGGQVFGPIMLGLGSLSLLDFGQFKSAAVGFRVVILVAVVGTLAEFIGVLTGFPFGNYSYTHHWIPYVTIQPHQVIPAFVGLAWVMIAGSWSATAAAWIPKSKLWQILFAAFASAMTDLVMEPIAVSRLGYWKWQLSGPLPGGAPVSNFVGWLMVSAIIAVIVMGHTRQPTGFSRQSKQSTPIPAAVVPLCHLVFLWTLSQIH